MFETAPYLSVSATGDYLVFFWMIAHGPEKCVGGYHPKAHKLPERGEEGDLNG